MSINKNRQNEIELFFKVIYLMLAFISFNSFCARQWYISYISYAVAFVGAIVIILRLTHLKDYLNIRVGILIIFMVSYLISAVNTIKYGFTENLQGMIWMCLQYFAVFAFDITADKDFIKKEFSIITKIFIVYTGLMSFIGLILMALNVSYYKIVDEYYIIAGGYQFNRLWGCYNDCNYGAIFAIVSIVLSIYYITKKPKLIFTIFLWINNICQYFYIAYSDSRTGQIAVVATSFVLLLGLLLRSKKLGNKFGNKKAVKILLSILISFVCAILLLVGTIAIQNVTSEIKAKRAYEEAIAQGQTEEVATEESEEAEVGRGEETIDYTQDPRMSIWRSALDISKDHPIIGISFRNIRDYVFAERPDSYLAQSGYNSMHNAFVDIIISQGALGLIIVLILIFFVLKKIVEYIPNTTDEEFREFIFIFSSLIAIVASMLTYSEVFYMNTAGAFMFWYLLGYLVNYKAVKAKE